MSTDRDSGKIQVDEGSKEAMGQVSIQETETDVEEKSKSPEDELPTGADDQNEPIPSNESDEEVIRSTRFCSKCGAQLKEGTRFCGDCGAKIEGAEAPASASRQKRRLNSKPIVGIAAAIILVALGIGIVIPEITATPEQLIGQGRYEAAYQKASDEEKPEVLSRIIGHGQFQVAYDSVADDQKDDVLVANLAAYCSRSLLDGLKDPSSFVLRQIYFDKNLHEMILEVSANNSSGGRVSNWYDYRFIEDDNEYKLYVSISDMSDETVYKYADSSDEKLEKLLKNAARENMRTIMGNKEMKIDSAFVDGVNELFESGDMGKVELISSVTSIYPEGNVV